MLAELAKLEGIARRRLVISFARTTPIYPTFHWKSMFQ